MTGEEIKLLRRKNKNDEREERSKILQPHLDKFHKLEKELEEICGRDVGHFFQKVYYNWGSFDDRQFTHEAFGCKYCEKRIYVHYSEVDKVNNHLK